MVSVEQLAGQLKLKRSGRGQWRGSCPACGYGSGAFVLFAGRNGAARGWCASCQDGVGVARAIGGGVQPPRHRNDPNASEDKAKAKDRALGIWAGSEPLTADTPAGRYLMRRTVPELIGNSILRYRADTPHPDRSRYPALVALVTGSDGQPVGIHRTYLQANGTKAAADPVKASLGPIWGGAIRLSDIDLDKPLVIGEGIETSASAGLLMGWPAWAALSAGNLAKGLVLPAEARRVAIARDPDQAGREAANAAWKRFRAEGRDVTIITPNGAGDFNDVLIARLPRDAGR